MAFNNKNNDVSIPMVPTDARNSNPKKKFAKMTSITERYRKKVAGENLNGANELIVAISTSNFAECKRLLENEHDISSLDKNSSFPPFLLAAKKGGDEIMNLLLEHNADINVQDKKQFTALHYAIQQRSVLCCEFLIERGIKSDIQDKSGNLPIHSAAAEGLLEIVDKLLKCHNNPNATNKKDQTPLHFACIKGNEGILNLLLDNGGRCDLVDTSRFTPLHCAAFHGNNECCDIIVEKLGEGAPGIDAENLDKATPLILAAKKGHSRCCLSLKQANISAADSKANTSLHHATSSGFLKTIEVLLEMTPNVNARNRDGNTPLHKAALQKNVDCLKLLVDHPGYIPCLNNSKQSVIHLAATKNCEESLQFLLSRPGFKEQINAKDTNGKTALQLALDQLHSESAEFLLNSGSDCFITDNKGNTALHVAAGRGMFGLCKLLLSGKRFALVNNRNLDGATPLHLAAMSGSIDCCNILLTKGADLTAVDSNGFNPFHVAVNEGNLGVVKLLTKKGGSYINRNVEVSGDTLLHLAARKGFYECVEFVLKSVNKDFITKLNNNDYSALDEAFNVNQDEIFSLILLKIPFPTTNQNYNFVQHYPFQSSLHEYMHKSIETNREIIQEAIVKSEWWFSGFSSCFCKKGQCPNIEVLTRNNVQVTEAVYDKCIVTDDTLTKYNFSLFEDAYYSPLDAKSNIDSRERESPFKSDTFQLKDNVEFYETQNPHPLLAAVETEALCLLQHRLTEAYLYYKWISYIRKL